jgi:PhnB protein
MLILIGITLNSLLALIHGGFFFYSPVALEKQLGRVISGGFDVGLLFITCGRSTTWGKATIVVPISHLQEHKNPRPARYCLLPPYPVACGISAVCRNSPFKLPYYDSKGIEERVHLCVTWLALTSKSWNMKLDFYINYKGNCKEAFRFYEQHLGGRITMMNTFRELPEAANIPEARKDDILHARIEIGGAVLMGADIEQAEPMRSAYLSLRVESAAEAERLYALLSDGGEIFMKMEQTFFASRFAMLRDRFGTSWMLLHEDAAMNN